MVRLPAGFSPTNALKTVADKVNPLDGTDTDYDVFGDVTVNGGKRNTSNGSNIQYTPQVLGTSTTRTPTGTTTTGGAGNGSPGTTYSEPAGSGSALSPAEKNASLYQIDSGIGAANDAIGRLGNQETIGNGNIDRDYQDAIDRLMGAKAVAESDYKQGVTDQINEFLSAKNNVASSARGWLGNARNVVGAQGAGGGSTARYRLPSEAQSMVTEGNAEAQGTNNKNLISLGTNWDRTQDEFTNSENDVNRQRDTGRNDLKSKIESARADLLNTIATLTGQKVIANGGGYQEALAASQPYTSKIASILGNIDSLSATPAIAERAVTVDRPDLAEYNFARPDAQVLPQQDPTLGRTPTIINPDDDQRKRNPILSLFGLDDSQQFA